MKKTKPEPFEKTIKYRYVAFQHRLEEALDPDKASGKSVSLDEMSSEKRAEMVRLYRKQMIIDRNQTLQKTAERQASILHALDEADGIQRQEAHQTATLPDDASSLRSIALWRYRPSAKYFRRTYSRRT